MKACLFILLFLVLFNCATDRLPIALEGDNFTVQAEEGKFVVDSFEASVVVIVNPESDSLWSYVSYSLGYHFENVPETVFLSLFYIKEYEAVDVHITPAFPSPVNKQRRWNYGWWLRNNLAGVDNVLIIVRLKGAFWVQI